MDINKIYNELVEVGKFHSGISFFWSIICCIIICALIYTIYSIFKDDNKFTNINAIIKKSDCKYYMTEKHGGKYSCNLGVEYEIDGKKYTGNIIQDDTVEYKEGSIIIISYQKSDPTIIKMKRCTFGLKIIIVILIFVMVVVPIQSYYKYYMAHKYNAYSSMYGIGTSFGHGFK